MKTREITLSASIMGIYLAIIIIAGTTPFKLTALMLSALFGLFWNYFSLKQNLGFQSLRFGFNVIRAIRLSPHRAAIIKTESIVGLAFLDWVNATMGEVRYGMGYQFLELTGKNEMSIIVLIIYLVYSFLYCSIIPYGFYRYFRRIGIYKRIPSF